MQNSKLTSYAFLFGLALMACAGTTNDKTNTSSSSDPASGSTSGKDMYYEYNLVTTGRNMKITATTKMYVAANGKMRVEMFVSNSMRPDSGGPIVIIGDQSKPDQSISIDDQQKTYSVNHFSDSDFSTGQKIQSVVSKIGEEKVMGFNCVHARIINNRDQGALASYIDTIDIWKSADVPLLSSIKDLMDRFESKTGNTVFSAEAVNQMKQMGCVGFMVQMQMHSKRSAMDDKLTKVEHRDLNESMFQIPAGYKEETSSF